MTSPLSPGQLLTQPDTRRIVLISLVCPVTVSPSWDGHLSRALPTVQSPAPSSAPSSASPSSYGSCLMDKGGAGAADAGPKGLWLRAHRPVGREAVEPPTPALLFPWLLITCSCTALSVHTHRPLCRFRPIRPSLVRSGPSVQAAVTSFFDAQAVHINSTVRHRTTNSSMLGSVDSIPHSLLSNLHFWCCDKYLTEASPSAYSPWLSVVHHCEEVKAGTQSR